MQGQVDPSYLSAASYLAEVGFANKTEIARVLDIAMNPNSLFVQASVNVNARPLTVEEDMRPVVEFLQVQGLSAADVVKVGLPAGDLPPTTACSLALHHHEVITQYHGRGGQETGRQNRPHRRTPGHLRLGTAQQ